MKTKNKKPRREEADYLPPEYRWMIWPPAPTLYELKKGLTKEHVRQVRDRKYDCPTCKAPKNVIYSHIAFKKETKDRGLVESKHLCAFCRDCNTRIRFVRDTAARHQAMKELEYSKKGKKREGKDSKGQRQRKRATN